MSEKDVTLSIGADTSALDSGMKDAQDSVRDAAQNIRGMLEGAFQFAGIDIAIESIKRVGDALMAMGDRAIEISTMSNVIGVSTDQFQAMQAAAEETGVGMGVFERSLEKIKILLDDARNGSGAAIEKLHEMGISNDQLADKQFNVNEALTVLHDRLNDASTAQDTMNALTKEFGARAAMATEAIKAYDGSLQGVAEADKKINALSSQQIEQLKKTGIAWHEIFTQAKNAAAGITAALVAQMSMHNEMGPESSEDLLGGAHQDATAAAADAKGAAQQLATMKVQLLQLVTAEDLKSEQAQIAATAEGTAKRLALAKSFFEDSKIYYGSANVDQVRKAFAEMEGAQRAFDRAVIEGERQQVEAGKAVSADKVRDWQKSVREMEEAQREFTKEVEESFREQVEQTMAATKEGSLKRIQDLSAEAQIAKQKFGEESTEYQSMVAKISAASRAFGAEQQKAIDQQSQSWLRFSNNIANTMTQSFMGMMRGTKTFSQSMVQMFDGMAEKVIGSLVRIGVQQAVQAATGIAAQRTAQQQSVLIDAKKAASGAYSALVGIPYIGPFIAPVAAGVAFAAVEAFSAADGMDIPSGLNPRVQLHEKEMVLPQQHADVIRGLANGGESGGGTHHHWNINAMDGHSVKNFLRDPSNRRLFQEAVSG